MKKQFILRCEENGFINFPQAKMPRVTNEFFFFLNGVPHSLETDIRYADIFGNEFKLNGVIGFLTLNKTLEMK